ncbi:pyruvate dehydrogenase complex dihydrolipoamide acetyltransferase [Magnetospirillum sulfuroxidans]|uniref:Acetyltransferase component of pyruvate dehydrogenase complex n=1 Tax=Magnetospirillum sulfuroxidans TaxID=611300 RepID=A0ABS5I8A9_9PROT|nr:pyruvate dehydrogenase complex dihydrolipoamide acetyltransferase [Magnetospirillum sulfuroxidans]MBR9970678.1 pyruvate dehydrogenase complex dihydrolipoamide acetyltransferase [Magnetospirillum sulfuroxidans]
MPIELLMPALSPTMTEGTLARWLKKEGDAVKSGDVLCEIETDKATMEFEAVDEGVLGKILIADGTAGVAVNTPIGVLLEEGEDASAIVAKPVAAAAPVPAPAAVAVPVAAAPAASAHGGDRVFASPLAKRIAGNAGLDLKAVKGSGPYGRVVKADVELALKGGVAAAPVASAAAAAPAPKAAAAPAAATANPFEPAFEAIPNSSMRKVIARRLTEAKSTIPHFYLSIDCELDALLKVRADLNGRSDAYKLSVNDFIIRAVALALKKVPAANASWGEEAIKRYTDVDVSVAVATPNGLITPIVHHADHKGLATISGEMKELAAKARDGKLKPEEFQGGGFTISNLGMFGVKDFAAIINPPQGCILAVGAGEQRPVVKAGALAIATVMTCTLSVDHRVVDGAVGAEFLAAFKKLVEDPLSMLL